MTSGWEKSVKGATKIKLAAPKSKYIEHILVATHIGEHGVAEIFRCLQSRLRDSAWTVVFKSLIVVHFMIREGQEDVTLRYLSTNPARKLAINNFTEAQPQGRNIRTYADYLIQRALCYGSAKLDFIRDDESRFKTLSVNKGLLRETENVQDQIKALCRCDFLSQEPENEIALTAFRLMTLDLLALFHVMNEGTINVLEHFFALSKPDAERGLKIYRTFARQTEQVVRYLSIARHYDQQTRLEIPKIKHAPTGLASSLEEYVRDPDFDINRRQYIAQQEAKKLSKTSNGTSKTVDIKATSSDSKPVDKSASKGPAPELIDFFSSIEQNQQTMAQTGFQQIPNQTKLQFNAQLPPQQTGSGLNPFLPQPTAMAPQQAAFSLYAQPTNPFLSMQQPMQQPIQQPTQQQPGQIPMQSVMSAGQFTGFSPSTQPRFGSNLATIPQANVASFHQTLQQYTGTTDGSSPSTNPFRQSMSSTSTGSVIGTSSTPFTSAQPSSTRQSPGPNPFSGPSSQQHPSPYDPGRSSLFSGQPHAGISFASGSQQGFQQQPSMAGGPFTNMNTNPFVQSAATITSFPHQPVMPQATGSTNPFRQSVFVNQGSGLAWQNPVQGTIGGVPSDQVQTVPVFPRPGMA